MLPSEKAELIRDIHQTLEELNDAISVVKDEAAFIGVKPSKLVHPDGTYILHPLLIAKASALNALAVLKKG